MLCHLKKFKQFTLTSALSKCLLHAVLLTFFKSLTIIVKCILLLSLILNEVDHVFCVYYFDFLSDEWAVHFLN